MDSQNRASIISIRLQMLLAVFNRRVTDEALEGLKRVFCDALIGFPEWAITKGFNKAEQELERFPTPKKMREICAESLPSQLWRYSFKRSTDRAGVPVLIDPDPYCDSCRLPKSAHPTLSCAFMDEREAQHMYRPQNCPEGRLFLAKLKEIADSVRRKRLP